MLSASSGVIDCVMVDWADEEFLSGKPVSEGEKTLAALAFYDSRFSKGGEGFLARSITDPF